MSDIVKPEKSAAFRQLCKEASATSKQYSMLASGDRVLVGISGGEDSLTLMHVMGHMQRRAPFPFELFPVFVDMQFPGVDRSGLLEYCAAQGWNLKVIALDGAKLIAEKHAGDKPCPLCSRLRRGKIHAAADELKCNKIALGHHMDDLCVSFLMSLFRGGGLKTMGPNVGADMANASSDGGKRLIRPFAMSEKSLIHDAAVPFGYPTMHSCPFEAQLDEHGDRAYLERLLKTLNLQFPYVRSAMRHSMGDIRLGHLLDRRYLQSPDDPDAGKL